MIFHLDKIIETLKVKFDFKFLNREASPSKEAKVSKSEVHGSVVGGDVNFTSTENSILSRQEKMVLKILDRQYKVTNYPRYPISETHFELGIANGQYVGTLNDSEFLRIDGENYVMTNKGIRYMDNLSEAELNKILLPAEEKELERRIKEALIRIENRRAQQNRDEESNPAI